MGNKTKQTKYKWQGQGKVVAVKASLPLQDPFQDPACYPQRRGIEQASQQHHYRCWWRPPQHPRFPYPPKEGGQRELKCAALSACVILNFYCAIIDLSKQ